MTPAFIETFVPQNKEEIIITEQNKNFNSVFTADRIFSLSIMATLRKKRKLPAVSGETPENTRNSRSQNTLDPELAQDYIFQVSEEIEGRVSKKLSKNFSRTESRILGALSKLDEFFLNPQVRTCSVAVQGTSRNSDSEIRETTGDRSRSGVLFPSLRPFKQLRGRRVSSQVGRRLCRCAATHTFKNYLTIYYLFMIKDKKTNAWPGDRLLDRNAIHRGTFSLHKNPSKQ